MSLKQAARLFADGDAEGALEALNELLVTKPKNVKGWLLKGRILQTTQNYDEAVTALQKAVELEPEEALAWKGLVTTYEKAKRYSAMLDSFDRFASVLLNQEDDRRQEATDMFQRIVRLVDSGGDKADKEKLLTVQLPGSMTYELLKGRLLPPITVLQKLIKAKKADLNTELSKLKSRRKTSLSMTPEKYSQAVLQTYEESPLQSLYEMLISMSDDDNDRRQSEAALLEIKLEVLENSPAKSKKALVGPLSSLAEDMTLFSPVKPDPFLIYWDWSDAKDYAQLEEGSLVKFTDLFPGHGLSHVIAGFLHSALNPFLSSTSVLPPPQEGEQADEDPAGEGPSSSAAGRSDTSVGTELELWSHQDIVAAFEDGFEDASNTLLGLRIVSDFYLLSTSYDRAAEVANEGLRLIRSWGQKYGLELPNSHEHFSLNFATANIYVQPPKHFPQSSTTFTEILQTDPDNLRAQLGQGLILMEQSDLKGAEKLLSAVAASHKDNFEAVSQLAWSHIRMGEYEKGREGLEDALQLVAGSQQLVHDRRALIKWRIGFSYWKEGEGEKAFNSFLASLQENPSFAPAFTFLGLIYHSNGDETRATKAFYKALELDAGQVTAGKHLAEGFAEEGRWDLVELIALRVLESDKVGELDPLTGAKIEWPYRALGIANLKKSDYGTAITNFQKCLRLVPSDANAWVGIGEAYTNTGRYKSAEKALLHALELGPNNISAIYELSIAQRETMQFKSAADTIQLAINLQEEPSALLYGVQVDNYVLAAETLMSNSYLGDAVVSANSALESSLRGLALSGSRQTLWTGVGNALLILASIRSHWPSINQKALAGIRQALGLTQVEMGESDTLSVLVGTIKGAFRAASDAAVETNSKSARAAAHFNQALLSIRLESISPSDVSNTSAIENLKQAISLEPRNARYWDLYGVSLSHKNDAVAQHCFIRSLVLDPRSTETWTNLGLFYLSHDDGSLASDAFDRALTIEPENSLAWVGQALVEHKLGKRANVPRLVEQAAAIAPGDDKISKTLLGYFSLERARESHGQVSLLGLVSLQKLLALDPTSEQALLTMALLLERSGDNELAITNLIKLAELQPNDSNVLSHIARNYLSMRDWEKSIEYSTEAMDALKDEDGAYIGVLLVNGLALYFQQEFEAALEVFRAVLDELPKDNDIILLLVQVLWANDGEADRETAIELLHESLMDGQNNLKASLMLGTIGLLLEDKELVSATRDALVSQDLDALLRDQELYAPDLLAESEKSKNPYYRYLMYLPKRYDLWKRVDPQQALEVMRAQAVDIKDLSNAYAADKSLESMRRAIMYCPGNQKAWRGFTSLAAQLTNV